MKRWWNTKTGRDSMTSGYGRRNVLNFACSGGVSFEWHVGEPWPPISNRRVLSIQADGDELGLIMSLWPAGIYQKPESAPSVRVQYEYICHSPTPLTRETTLKEAGEDGWQLAAIWGERFIFMREVERVR